MNDKIKALDHAVKRFENFPNQGNLFYDITPIFQQPNLFNFVLEEMKNFIESVNAQVIVCPEARGFIFGGALACKTQLPLILVRKEKKLPGDVISETYDLEYRKNSVLEMHNDILLKNQRCVVVDDLLATAGTVAAIDRLIERLNAQTVGYCFLGELKKLNGKAKLKPKIATKILLGF